MLSVVIYTLGLNSRVDTLDFNGMRAFTARPRRTVTRPIPADVCSPPDHFAGLTHPDLELSVTRTTVHGIEHAFGVRRVAARPSVFHLRGLLSDAECDDVIAAADSNMKQATTAGGDLRSGCSVSWLPVDENPVAGALAGVVGDLLLSPEAADYGGEFENLQVLRYETGGVFNLHHDANENTPRLLTVLLYLNGEGETWFPLAIAEDEVARTAGNPASRDATLNACSQLEPWKDGLTVAPEKGDAIAFYNLRQDGSGDLDRLAFHSGLPAAAEKRVAALWWRCGDGPIES